MTDDELMRHLHSSANRLVNYSGDRIQILQEQNLQLSGICYDLIAQRDELFQLVQQALSIFENCSVSTDICCCGDSMSSHGDAISCGHTPVDMGDYQSSLWLSKARGILKEELK